MNPIEKRPDSDVHIAFEMASGPGRGLDLFMSVGLAEKLRSALSEVDFGGQFEKTVEVWVAAEHQ